MNFRWSDKETLKLIELYKSYNFLWDKTLPLYKIWHARKTAYKEIVQKMNIPTLKEQDVKSKIKNLRTAYYLEQRRSLKEGKVRPTLPWVKALQPVMEHAQELAQKEFPHLSLSESSDENEGQIEDTLFVEENTSNSDAYVVSIKQEYLDDMENHAIEEDDILIEPVPKKHKKTKRQNEEILEQKQSTERKNKKKVDEFQMFANNIAAQLRNLPLDKALNLQVKLQTLIAKERIELFKSLNEEELEEESS